MEKTPDFLMQRETEELDFDAMSTLKSLIDAYDDAAAKLEEAEKVAKQAKERFNSYALDQIPEFLLMHGVKKLGLSDGREVVIKEDISVTVKDEVAFREFLRERHEDDILKINYAFARMDSDKIEALSDFLIDSDYDFDINEAVHPQTKKKYFKELIADIGRSELPDWVSIYDVRKAHIK